ncbi:gluconokinase, GntK/IdnK-type [Termitidicoccus mucosus]|uniref:gluconokinase, GntK/IdnK-type n=1 Tax=Termitidicoccus mucosus TaxID=1184151 RepID=UPI0026BB5089
MPRIPGLRSPYAKVGGLVYFGRMLDKIRLHAAGKLPPDYVASFGDSLPLKFDTACCRFLGVRHADLAARALAPGAPSDEALLDWARNSAASPRSDGDLAMWNDFMIKRGWRDDRVSRVRERVADAGLTDKPVMTMFDFIDYDEGRDPARTRPWEYRLAKIVVLTGVAGCGKTTVGRALADALGWYFEDADAFHSPASIAKMSAGIPLDDADREPWLAAIRARIAECLRDGESTVFACSALRAAYRAALVPAGPSDETRARVRFVFLKGEPGLLRRRLLARRDHFMKTDMLDSQFAALEEPAPGEADIIDAARTVAEITAEIRLRLGA